MERGGKLIDGKNVRRGEEKRVAGIGTGEGERSFLILFNTHTHTLTHTHYNFLFPPPPLLHYPSSFPLVNSILEDLEVR